MKALFLVAMMMAASVPVQIHAYSWEVESLKDKQARLEVEIKTKTGDDKLASYCELLSKDFYVPDEIRLQHIQLMLSEYEPSNNPKGIGIALAALASLQGKQGNCTEAVATCEKAMPFALACAESFPEIRFHLLCTQAVLARAVGDLKQSCQLAMEALRFAKPWGDRLELNRAYHALSLSSYLRGVASEDQPYLKKQYEFTERTGDVRGETAAALLTGFRLMRDGHLEQSECWISKAEKLLLQINSPRLNLLVKLRRAQLDFLVSRDKKEHHRTMNELVKMDQGPLSVSDQLFFWNAFARAKREVGRFDEAEKAVFKQLEAVRGNATYETIAQLHIANFFIQQSQRDEENKTKILDSAIQRLKGVKDDTSDSLRQEEHRLKLLATAYRYKEDFEAALNALRAKNKFSAKIFTENTLRQSELIGGMFQDRERELELEMAKQQKLAAEAKLSLQLSKTNANNRIRNLIGVSVLALSCITLVGFWQHFNRINRQQDRHTRLLSTELEQRTDELRIESEKRKTLAVDNERKRRNETVGKIAGGIAHDFNNLLSVIVQSNEILANGMAPDQSEKVLQRSNAAADTATDIVRQLMAYVSKTPLTNSLVGVDLWLDDVSGLFESAIPSAVDFQIENSTKGLNIHSDSAQLTTAVINIITNAKDAVHDRPSPKITLKLERKMSSECPDEFQALSSSDDCLEVRVTDNGNGMTPEQKEFACDPFVTSKNAGIGTGLGLSMVLGFVRQSGGHLQIQSERDCGTCVAMYFPIASQDVESSDHQAMPNQQRKFETVLLVEDNPVVRDAIGTTLERIGYSVQAVCDGDKAILHLQNNSTPDLVLSDVQMPGTSGIKLRQWILQNELPTTVILMSGFHQDELGDEVLFLPKPFRMSALEKLVIKSPQRIRTQSS